MEKVSNRSPTSTLQKKKKRFKMVLSCEDKELEKKLDKKILSLNPYSKQVVLFLF